MAGRRSPEGRPIRRLTWPPDPTGACPTANSNTDRDATPPSVAPRLRERALQPVHSGRIAERDPAILCEDQATDHTHVWHWTGARCDGDAEMPVHASLDRPALDLPEARHIAPAKWDLGRGR